MWPFKKKTEETAVLDEMTFVPVDAMTTPSAPIPVNDVFYAGGSDPKMVKVVCQPLDEWTEYQNYPWPTELPVDPKRFDVIVSNDGVCERIVIRRVWVQGALVLELGKEGGYYDPRVVRSKKGNS